jgi:hypothetical protein
MGFLNGILSSFEGYSCGQNALSSTAVSGGKIDFIFGKF